MAQAQLNFNNSLPVAAPKQYYIYISPELKIKVRNKAGQMVVLFYHANKKSFSLPLDLFFEVVKSQDVVSFASQLIRGDFFMTENGYVDASSDRCHNAVHCEQL